MLLVSARRRVRGAITMRWEAWMWPVLKGVNVLVILVVLYGYMGVFWVVWCQLRGRCEVEDLLDFITKLVRVDYQSVVNHV